MRRAGKWGLLGALVGGRIQRRFTFGQVVTAIVWIQAVGCDEASASVR